MLSEVFQIKHSARFEIAQIVDVSFHVRFGEDVEKWPLRITNFLPPVVEMSLYPRFFIRRLFMRVRTFPEGCTNRHQRPSRVLLE